MSTYHKHKHDHTTEPGNCSSVPTHGPRRIPKWTLHTSHISYGAVVGTSPDSDPFFCQLSETARLPRGQSPPYGTAVYLLALVLPNVVFNLVVVGKSRTRAKRRATLSTHDPTHSSALSLPHAALVHLSFCICQATASSPQIRHCLTAPVSELAPITPYFQWLLLT